MQFSRQHVITRCFGILFNLNEHFDRSNTSLQTLNQTQLVAHSNGPQATRRRSKDQRQPRCIQIPKLQKSEVFMAHNLLGHLCNNFLVYQKKQFLLLDPFLYKQCQRLIRIRMGLQITQFRLVGLVTKFLKGYDSFSPYIHILYQSLYLNAVKISC